MAALVLKNLPEGLLDQLKDRARSNHRSLTKEAVVLLSSGVAQPSNTSRAPVHSSVPVAQVGGPMSADEIEYATHAGPDDPWPPRDGREALRAALVKQPDGGYINVLGIDDESFFTTLENVRSEIRLPDLPDFSEGPA
jgi:plasmid stability protein